jgi:hypothetical protein
MPERVNIAGFDLGQLIEISDNVAVLTEATRPIMIKEPQRAFAAYEAREIAELLIRPDAHELGMQLLRAVEVLETKR